MQQNRPVRIIKREQRERAAAAQPAVEAAPENPERKLRGVVTGWVRDHRQRTEEYRRAFKDILVEAGFRAPRPSRA